MIKYYKLFILLDRLGMKKTDLLQIMSRTTLAKLSNGEYVNTEIIDRICQLLKCQPGDIMECYIENPNNESPIKVGEEEIQKAIKEAMTPEFVNNIFKFMTENFSTEEIEGSAELINKMQTKENEIKKQMQEKEKK